MRPRWSASRTRVPCPPRWCRLLPAVLALAPLSTAFPQPATAQPGLGAVVCIGSEPGVVAGGDPDRTIPRDEEFGYVTDVDTVYMQEAEEAVREQLVGYPLIRCARSGPGDTHVVVVRFSAVVRRDDEVGPEDPRFTNFAIGFGASWGDAEARATTLNERFTTYNDGSSYGKFLQLRWGEVEADPDRPVVPRPEPEGLFRDCEACPGMVVVPAGTFTMGSPDSEEGRERNEQPLHQVTIGAPFAVGAYEVTFAEWAACELAGDCEVVRPDDGVEGRDRYPVGVTWVQAQAYVAWLSAETGQRYRLLSEAEWEYVARAGTPGMRYWGDGEAGQCEHANAQDRVYLTERPSERAAACSDGYAGPGAGGTVCAERLRAARHPGQPVRVDPGLLEPALRGSTDRRQRLGDGKLWRPGGARGWLGNPARRPARGGPLSPGDRLRANRIPGRPGPELSERDRTEPPKCRVYITTCNARFTCELSRRVPRARLPSIADA